MPVSEPVRRQRSDAQQNAAALLEAARAVFASSGVDAPAKEITDLAGLGVGTMYRHFPRRSDLVAAVLATEIDACADAAATIAAENEPWDALTMWVERLTDLVAKKRGLAAALHSDDPGLFEIGPYILERLEPALRGLLDAARRSGDVTSDIGAKDVIMGVSLLCHPIPDEPVDFNRRLVDTFLRGLR